MMRYLSFTLVAFLCGVDAGTIKKLRGNSNNVVSSATKRKLQHHGHQTQRRLASMLFKESTCNENITSAECISIDTFLSTQSPSSSEVKMNVASVSRLIPPIIHSITLHMGLISWVN